MIGILALLMAAPAFGLSGSIQSSTDSYSQNIGTPTDTLAPYLQFDLTSKHKFSKQLRLQWKLFALTILAAEGKGSTEKEPFNEKVFIDLPEAFVERKLGDAKIRLGMNTVNWGVVDGYSPSNVVNTAAYFHPLRTPKRGAPMVDLQAGGESFGVEALYIPWQPRAILPATDSRWLPRDVLVNLSSALPSVALPDHLEYTYGSEIELNHARENNYGLKLNSHLGSWDFQATHFDGASPFPKIRPTLTINSVGNDFVAQSPIRLDPVSYRVRTTGAGITYAASKWIYRLEGAYTHVISDGFGLPPWSWTTVAGVETNLNIGSHAMTVIAQYYHSETPVLADNYISSSYRLFDRTAVLALRWPFSDSWTMNDSVLNETESQSWFWTAGFEQKIKDVFKWGLGWRDFSAAKPGLIKTFERNDHVNLDLTYFF